MKRTAKRSERGMASILITMITMMVISLIVLGFANVARRERGQSLDRQLSTQAFYAAESGIEDARSVIDKAVEKGLAVPAKDACATNTANMAGYPVPYPTGNATTLKDNAAYSCLLVNPNPTSLQYNGVDADSTVIPINAPSSINRIEVKWSPSTKPQDCARTNNTGSAGCPATNCLSATTNMTNDRFLLPSGSWKCLYGLMRMDVVATAPTANIGGTNRQISRDRLLNGSVAGWFVPTQDTTANDRLNYGTRAGANIGGNPTPNIREAKCDGPVYGVCTAIIDGLTAGNQYALRLSSMYQPSNVTVIAYADTTTSAPLPLTGAQAVVDVTGKAQDVLRRIVARIPVNASRGQVPGFAIQSNGSLCKRFEVTPDYLKIPGNFPTAQPDNQNDMCKSITDGEPEVTPVSTTTPTTPTPPSPPTGLACSTAFDVGLILDTSTSMDTPFGNTTRLEKLKEVALRLATDDSVSGPRNHVAIGNFGGINSTNGRINSNLTFDKNALRRIITGGFKMDEGGTWYVSGLVPMENELLRGGSARPDSGVSYAAPNVAVFISDGSPWDEHDDILRTTNRMLREGITIFTIGIGDEDDINDSKLDRKLLSDMSGNGGYFADARNPAELDAAINAITRSIDCV